MQSIQDACGLFTPDVGIVQGAEGILPQDILGSAAMQEAIPAVLGIAQLDCQGLQCKGRGKGPDVRVHQTAGNIRRIHIGNDLGEPLEGCGRRQHTAAGLCARAGDHQLLPRQGNRLIHVLFLTGSQVKQGLSNFTEGTDIAAFGFRWFGGFVRSFHTACALLFIEFSVGVLDKLLQLAALVFRQNTAACGELAFLEPHDNHAAHAG